MPLNRKNLHIKIRAEKKLHLYLRNADSLKHVFHLQMIDIHIILHDYDYNHLITITITMTLTADLALFSFRFYFSDHPSIILQFFFKFTGHDYARLRLRVVIGPAPPSYQVLCEADELDVSPLQLVNLLIDLSHVFTVHLV